MSAVFNIVQNSNIRTNFGERFFDENKKIIIFSGETKLKFLSKSKLYMMVGLYLIIIRNI